jgi:CDP-diacylglycerol--glycerol-3-phosphate 3-phosphatidyltransferase
MRHGGGASGPAPCPHQGCQSLAREPLATPANLVTAVRTLGCVVLAALALVTRREELLFVALAVYWAGDVLDGYVARRSDSETRAGAVLDILSDRLCSAVFYVGYAVLHPGDVVPIAVFLVQFMVVDAYLSLAFLAWPLRSPNYFGLVDRLVFALNWSKPGKAVNSAALALLLVLTDGVVLPTVLVGAVLVLKCWSLVLVTRLDAPSPAGCAAPGDGDTPDVLVPPQSAPA